MPGAIAPEPIALAVAAIAVFALGKRMAARAAVPRDRGRPMSGAAPLRARGLGRSYDGFLALSSLDLELGAGELVALVGPNGAGKTTFLMLAAGLLEPTTGKVEIGGAAAGSIAARRDLSYIPDTPVFYEDVSLGEHLEYVAALHESEGAEARIASLLSAPRPRRVGGRAALQFSRGMRQKASIALALVRPFSVLLADEPLRRPRPSEPRRVSSSCSPSPAPAAPR